MSSETEIQNSHGHHDGDHGHGGVGKYLVVFILLCLLTSASFFTYSSMWPWKDTPWVGWSFMMAVSCTKALLVMLCFMHLWWEANWKYVLTFPAAMMCVFLLLMLVPDVGMRTSNYSEQRWLHAADPPVENNHEDHKRSVRHAEHDDDHSNSHGHEY